MSTARSKADDARLGFVDDARGLAVVLMIFWHTVDGWIRRDLHAAHPQVLDIMRVFGGTAAPMFVMLAGVGAALKLNGDHARGRSKWVSMRQLAARGLHVVATGYALRVYMWLVDDRALFRLSAAPSFIPLVIGLGCLLVGFSRLADAKRESLPLVIGGLSAFAFGIQQAFVVAPLKAPYLLKVDVLQAIGTSITFVALAEPFLATTRRPWLALLVGFVLALPTDLVAQHLPGELRLPFAAYLGKWDTPLGRSLPAFPIFPWVGYAFVGSAVGHLWLRFANERKPDMAVFGVGAVATAIAAITNGPPVHQYLLPAYPIAYKAVFMLHKIGFGLGLLMLVVLFVRMAGRSPLRELGQTSMVIYWVHLEFAYGLCAKPLKHRLDYLEWGVGFVLLTLAMAVVARIRLRFPDWWAARRAAYAARLDRG